MQSEWASWMKKGNKMAKRSKSEESGKWEVSKKCETSGARGSWQEHFF